MESALITIPSGNAAIESAFQSGSTSVFMQLTDPTNAICMLGPYSVIKAFTSLTISRGAMAPLPSVTVSSSTTISSPSMSVTATESVSTISISSAIPSTVGSSPSPSANVSDSALSSSSIPLVTILASVFGVLLLAAIALWFFLFYRKRQQKGSTSPWVASEKGAVGGDSVRALNADGDSIVSVSDGLTDKASISNYSPALGALDVNSSASGYVMSQKDAEDISIAFRNELFNKDNIE